MKRMTLALAGVLVVCALMSERASAAPEADSCNSTNSLGQRAPARTSGCQGLTALAAVVM
jgi:hypothetical protein